MFILQIDASKITGAQNKTEGSKPIDTPDSVLLNSLSQTPELNQTEGIQGTNKPSQEMLHGKIIDLANKYIIYAQTYKDPCTGGRPCLLYIQSPPWEESNELYEALAQYTGTPASDENIDGVKSFFYGIMKNKPIDPNKDGRLDYNDVLSIWGVDHSPGALLQKIQTLSKNLLEDMSHHLSEVQDLTKALAKYTHTEYTVGKANSFLDFFSGSDLTGDDKIDYQDVIAYWKKLDDTIPRFPVDVDIDLNHDGKFDYTIRHNKIFKMAEDGKTILESNELKNIPGIDLFELASVIEKKFKECNYSDKVDFDLDINHDGKKDRIYSWDVIASWKNLNKPNPMPRPPFRSPELDNIKS